MNCFTRSYRGTLSAHSRPPFRRNCFIRNGLRPRQNVVGRLRGRRLASTEAGENESGHIFAGPNEGILFFDNILPLRLQVAHRLPWHLDTSLVEILTNVNKSAGAVTNPINILKRAVPEGTFQVTQVLPRLKEGGAFVKFSHVEGTSSVEIESSVKRYLESNPIKPWFNPFRQVRGALVRGRPWLEDLYRFPSSRLRVEFIPTTPEGTAAELSQETLYSLFRRYGKLQDIIPQPADSKVLPKFAHLNFLSVGNAIMAKNCMHGFRVSEAQGGGKAETALRLIYERKAKAHWIRDWIMSHPRIVIPAVAALIATITAAAFDPIRTWFIKAHITHSLHIQDTKIWRWFKAQATDIFTFKRKSSEVAGLNAIWDDRKESIGQIQTWLMETAETFIVVQGPRGSGKRELVVDQALKNWKHKLVIDCKPIQEAHGDSGTIRAAAAAVGYRPVFSWMNNISSMLDLAAQGTFGTKTGFSETLDTQLAKIWQNTATALRQVALEDRKKDDKDANLNDDEYLEAHPEKRPVVVIDNFLHKNEERTIVYDKVSEWAAALVTANVAHVIFLTNDVSFSKSLSKALPDRVFRMISLGDCSPEAAKRFVLTHLEIYGSELQNTTDSQGGEDGKVAESIKTQDLRELDECTEVLGGRLTDLEFLARRIKMGETPKIALEPVLLSKIFGTADTYTEAINEIIEQSASEILKMYLLDVDRTARKWTPEQAWLLIKEFAKNDVLRYNELLLSDLYKTDGDAVLQALEQAELITIVSNNGRPHSIRPGKPVYAAAFRRLTDDHVLKSRLDLAILTELVKMENANIDKYENELGRLGALPKQPAELGSRTGWLLKKIAGSQAKVEAYETEMGTLKKVLAKEF